MYSTRDYIFSYNKKVDLSNVPFKFGIDSSGNYGYKKAGADTVIPFKSQSDIDNAYNNGYTKGKAEYSSIFIPPDDSKVGNVGTITDGTYNKDWVIYTISGNTYQLFPMQNLGDHVMNPTDTNVGGYTASEMYGYVHNTVLPRLKQSGLNITSCDLVSQSVYNDICSKTGKTSNDIIHDGVFWMTDPYISTSTGFVYSRGAVDAETYERFTGASFSHGVRPLITVVK